MQTILRWAGLDPASRQNRVRLAGKRRAQAAIGRRLVLGVLIGGLINAVTLLASATQSVRAEQTATRSDCDPHYVSQTCVPIAKDVDCAGGEGNGPAYVTGPFEYVGEDIYGLDRNHDGVACEPVPRN